MNVSVRDVNEQVFRKFKSEAVKENLKVGNALNEAISMWLESKKEKKEKKKDLSDLNAWDWGKDNENASQEIDEVLYGDKK